MEFIQEGENQFSLSLAGEIIIKHSIDTPFLLYGKGKTDYEINCGNFEIEDNLFEKAGLYNIEILNQEPDHIQIKFFAPDSYQCIVDFREEKGRLEVHFSQVSEVADRMWIRLEAAADEHIYGCGEQFSELDLNGKRVPIWVSEAGVGRNEEDYISFKAHVMDGSGGDWYTTYFPQPTFVSSRNYYCHVDDSHYMEFDFRTDAYHELAVHSIPEKIVFSAQETAVDVIEDLTDLLGRQPELPDWAYDGVWLGLQGGTGAIKEKMNTALENDVEVAALWVQDWEGKRETEFGKQLMWDWKYDEDMYPDLEHTIQELDEQQGIKFLGYINPFLALEGDLYQEASEKGYLVENEAGEEYHVTVTTFPVALVDLTNPEAKEWMKDVIKENMIDLGLAGWMADFGEYLPTDAVVHSGEDGKSLHNKYPAIWAQTNREALEETDEVGDIVFFTRAGYTGSSNYTTLMWSGDQFVNWSRDDGLPSVIPASISLGLTGVGLTHFDVGGYTSLFGVTRTKELFKRWTELGAFTPVMRTHEGNRPDENLQFDHDQEILDHFARMSKIHKQLKPYLQEVVQTTAQRGLPAIRHPYLHYENDEEVYNLKYQYLLGRDLLVAPVCDKEVRAKEVYLPDDEWVHLWTGEEYKSGWQEVEAQIGYPPVFYRKGSDYSQLFAEVGQL